MLDSIQPGDRIAVRITRQPTNAAAVKTLQRVLAKDPQVKAEHERYRKIRKKNYNPGMRGGRLYAGQLVKQHPIKGQTGESGQVRATVDVLRDLRSVERFIEVSRA